MARYRVAEGTQVHLDGVTYDGGAQVVTDADVSHEVKAGWLLEADVETKPVRKLTRKAQ